MTFGSASGRGLRVGLVWFLMTVALASDAPKPALKRGDSPDARTSSVLRQTLSPGLSILTSEFYGRRDFAPAWSVEGRVRRSALSLLKSLCGASAEALEPGDYQVERLAGLLSEALRSRRAPSPDLLADLDVSLTDAFFLYASHLACGKVDQENLVPRWTGTLSPSRSRTAGAFGTEMLSQPRSRIASAYGPGTLPHSRDRMLALIRTGTLSPPRSRTAGAFGAEPLSQSRSRIAVAYGAEPPRDEDLLGRLEKVALGLEPVETTLRCLAPSHPSYRRLVKAREEYLARAARGGWRAVPEGPALRPGDKGKRVKALRARLLAGGDLGIEEARRGRAAAYGAELAAAVARFQKRHGLAATGEADGPTLAALAVPVETRLRQIEANLERWRWLRRDLGARHIIVNIADFHLEAVEAGATSFRMKIVAGNASWQTPVFSADLVYFVLNPFWNTPENVLARELINYIRADPKYLEANGMSLFRPAEDGEREMLRDEIDWRAVDRGRIGFRLRQNPGPANVLGRVKFMLPNPYDIYLHDTPYREDFGKPVRTFSHGCIRIEKPLDLALWLLAGDRRWTPGKLERALDSASDLSVKLRERLPVHVTYATAWADADGTVEFREDIYGRDEPLRAALAAPPPGGELRRP